MKRARKRRRAADAVGLLLAGVLLVACPCAWGLDPALDVTQYAHTSWKVRDGFAKGPITAIAQTPDGYLWIGTEFGLFRFDGVKAVPWQPPPGEQLPSNAVRRLLVSRDGTLWIATIKGLASWKDGKLARYADLAGLSVFALLEDREGSVWAGSYGLPTGRLCAIDNGVRCWGEDGALGSIIFGLYEDAQGNLWAGVPNGMWRWKPGPPQFYSLPGNPGGIRAFAEDADGTLLIGAKTAVQRFVDGKTTNFKLPATATPLPPEMLFRDRDGGLWVATNGIGIVHEHHGRADVFSQLDGLSSNNVRDIFADREGNIWVATRDGLDRFRDLAVVTLTTNQGLLPGGGVAAVLAGRDGSVWLSNREGLIRWNDGQITAYGKSDRNLNGRTPHSLFQDSHGRIWVSTVDGVGHMEGNRFVPVSGIPGGFVQGIAEDGAENLWFANQRNGLIRLSPQGEIQQTPWSSLAPDKVGPSALATDPSRRGGLWIGFFQGGVLYFKDGEVRASHSTADGLGEGQVSRFRFDADGTVWAATQGGLSRLKNRHISTLTSKNGLPCDAVHWVIRDDDQAFWLYMPCGLVRVARSEVDAWAAAVDKDRNTKHTIQTMVFDGSDGVTALAAPGGYNPRVVRAADGRLWFRSVDGVSVVDPHHLPVNRLVPPVHIEQITADRKTYDAAAYGNGGVRLPARTRDLEIDYTALSLAVPEKVRFRYKLEGRDGDWQDAGNRRQAFYSDLAPRKYRFRVMACNNSGVWNEAGAFLDFSVAPTYYQTWWFRSLSAAAFLALLWTVYQLRLRQVAREFNMHLDGRVTERTRIARELHDTLLQDFQAILLFFQGATDLLPDRPELAKAKEKLQGAITRGAQAVRDGRDAVQGLRFSTIETNDLSAALGVFAKELAASETSERPPVFDLEVDGTPRDLHPILRDEVYRIATEALRNAFRHAHASRIEVEVLYGAQQLRVRIRDDGKGVDAQIVTDKGRAGHWGLPGMHERAKLLGGSLEVWSKRNTGTEIELSIPAAVAYAGSGTRRGVWFSRKGTAVKS